MSRQGGHGLNPALYLPPVPGVHRREAYRLFRYALEQGMSWLRARVLAAAASYGEKVWAFQGGLADFVGCSLRTVQRAFDEAKHLGLVTSRRSRQGELTPTGKYLKCGFALRTFTTWHTRSRRRYNQIAARCALQDVYRRARAEQNKRDRAEIREAVAEFQALGP